jgi:alkylation response protein AidB-like acyl-CoA dehydrogenase
MALVLTEDQQMLKSSAADFVKKESPVVRVRHLRDSDDPVGYSPDLWRKMAELGWPALLGPEAHGGRGLGVRTVGDAPALGRQVLAEVVETTVLLAEQVLNRDLDVAEGQLRGIGGAQTDLVELAPHLVTRPVGLAEKQ